MPLDTRAGRTELANRNPSLQIGQSAALPAGGQRRLTPANTQTDGVGFEPTNEFSPLPVFKVGKAPPGTAIAIALKNKGETLLKPSSTSQRGPGPRRETETNRDKPRQTETKQAKSRPLTRQVTDKSRQRCLDLALYGENRESSTLPRQDQPRDLLTGLQDGLGPPLIEDGLPQRRVHEQPREGHPYDGRRRGGGFGRVDRLPFEAGQTFGITPHPLNAVPATPSSRLAG